MSDSCHFSPSLLLFPPAPPSKKVHRRRRMKRQGIMQRSLAALTRGNKRESVVVTLERKKGRKELSGMSTPIIGRMPNSSPPPVPPPPPPPHSPPPPLSEGILLFSSGPSLPREEWKKEGVGAAFSCTCALSHVCVCVLTWSSCLFSSFSCRRRCRRRRHFQQTHPDTRRNNNISPLPASVVLKR